MPAAASIPPSLTSVPSSFNAQSSGNVAFNNQYFYVKYKGWRRFPLTRTSNLGHGFPLPSHNGDIFTDNQYFYIVVEREWMRMPIPVIKLRRPVIGSVLPMNLQETKLTTFPRGTDNYGRWGMISFNAEYFCIWSQGKWHKTPITRMPVQLYGRDVVRANPIPPQGTVILTIALV